MSKIENLKKQLQEIENELKLEQDRIWKEEMEKNKTPVNILVSDIKKKHNINVSQMFIENLLDFVGVKEKITYEDYLIIHGHCGSCNDKNGTYYYYCRKCDFSNIRCKKCYGSSNRHFCHKCDSDFKNMEYKINCDGYIKNIDGLKNILNEIILFMDKQKEYLNKYK